MENVSGYIIAGISAFVTLGAKYGITKIMKSGNVKTSDAETIFKASEAIRNDLALELVATRKERDDYRDKYNECMESRKNDRF